MAKFAISEEKKTEQYEQLRRTRIPRMVLLIVAICLMDFLNHFEPFRSNFWLAFLAAIIAATVGYFFIFWIDSKRHPAADCSSLTTPK